MLERELGGREVHRAFARLIEGNRGGDRSRAGAELPQRALDHQAVEGDASGQRIGERLKRLGEGDTPIGGGRKHQARHRPILAIGRARALVNGERNSRGARLDARRRGALAHRATREGDRIGRAAVAPKRFRPLAVLVGPGIGGARGHQEELVDPVGIRLVLDGCIERHRLRAGDRRRASRRNGEVGQLHLIGEGVRQIDQADREVANEGNRALGSILERAASGIGQVELQDGPRVQGQLLGRDGGSHHARHIGRQRAAFFNENRRAGRENHIAFQPRARLDRDGRIGLAINQGVCGPADAVAEGAALNVNRYALEEVAIRAKERDRLDPGAGAALGELARTIITEVHTRDADMAGDRGPCGNHQTGVLLGEGQALILVTAEGDLVVTAGFNNQRTVDDQALTIPSCPPRHAWIAHERHRSIAQGDCADMRVILGIPRAPVVVRFHRGIVHNHRGERLTQGVVTLEAEGRAIGDLEDRIGQVSRSICRAFARVGAIVDQRAAVDDVALSGGIGARAANPVEGALGDMQAGDAFKLEGIGCQRHRANTRLAEDALAGDGRRAGVIAIFGRVEPEGAIVDLQLVQVLAREGELAGLGLLDGGLGGGGAGAGHIIVDPTEGAGGGAGALGEADGDIRGHHHIGGAGEEVLGEGDLGAGEGGVEIDRAGGEDALGAIEQEIRAARDAQIGRGGDHIGGEIGGGGDLGPAGRRIGGINPAALHLTISGLARPAGGVGPIAGAQAIVGDAIGALHNLQRGQTHRGGRTKLPLINRANLNILAIGHIQAQVEHIGGVDEVAGDEAAVAAPDIGAVGRSHEAIDRRVGAPIARADLHANGGIGDRAISRAGEEEVEIAILEGHALDHHLPTVVDARGGEAAGREQRRIIPDILPLEEARREADIPIPAARRDRLGTRGDEGDFAGGGLTLIGGHASHSGIGAQELAAVIALGHKVRAIAAVGCKVVPVDARVGDGAAVTRVEAHPSRIARALAGEVEVERRGEGGGRSVDHHGRIELGIGVAGGDGGGDAGQRGRGRALDQARGDPREGIGFARAGHRLVREHITIGDRALQQADNLLRHGIALAIGDGVAGLVGDGLAHLNAHAHGGEVGFAREVQEQRRGHAIGGVAIREEEEGGGRLVLGRVEVTQRVGILLTIPAGGGEPGRNHLVGRALKGELADVDHIAHQVEAIVAHLQTVTGIGERLAQDEVDRIDGLSRVPTHHLHRLAPGGGGNRIRRQERSHRHGAIGGEEGAVAA